MITVTEHYYTFYNHFLLSFIIFLLGILTIFNGKITQNVTETDSLKFELQNSQYFLIQKLATQYLIKQGESKL